MFKLFVLSCLLAVVAAKPGYVAPTYTYSSGPQYSDISLSGVPSYTGGVPYTYSVQAPGVRQYVVSQPSYGSYAYGSPVQYSPSVVRTVPVVSRPAYSRSLPINSGWVW